MPVWQTSRPDEPTICPNGHNVYTYWGYIVANVTFSITDLTGEPLPTNVAPEVIFTPSETTITQAGNVITTHPAHYTPDASGAVTANLLTTDDIAHPRFHYTLQIRWLNPDGYGATGYTVIDFPTWKIRVPAGGGQLADFTDIPARTDAFWVGATPPPTGSGYVYWVDISGVTPVLKEWSA